VKMAESKKNKNKPKLNVTVREQQRNKLEQMASLEKRSVSNLIEVMAGERWERLVEQRGRIHHVKYRKMTAEGASGTGAGVKRRDAVMQLAHVQAGRGARFEC
jgi:hypothetical protein